MGKHPSSVFKKWNIANEITLKDGKEILISDDAVVSEELNHYFQNAAKTLNIVKSSHIIDSVTDPVDKAIKTYTKCSCISLKYRSFSWNTTHVFFSCCWVANSGP